MKWNDNNPILGEISIKKRELGVNEKNRTLEK